jgi:hypothetical protein
LGGEGWGTDDPGLIGEAIARKRQSASGGASLLEFAAVARSGP